MQQILIESSLTGLFRLILYILVIYAIYSFVVRVVFPLLIRNAVQGMQKQQENLRDQSYASGKKKEGEITIEYVDPKPVKPADSGQDDYVDYEEVK